MQTNWNEMRWGLAAMAALFVAGGCESSAPVPTGSSQSASAPAPPQPAAPGDPNGKTKEAVGAAPAKDAAGKQAPTTTSPAATPSPATAAPPADAEGTLKQAEVGVGVKGQNYGGPGFITTPVATKFRIEERIAFDVQIPSAMKLYKAEHDNKGPKTHEEFMEVIVKEHGVQLPELAPGESYLYDPKTEELMVKSPSGQ